MLPKSSGFAAVVCALVLSGCATTGRTPVQLVPSRGIGIAVISRSPAEMTVAGPSAAHGEHAGGPGGGTAPGAALLGLLLLPVEAIYAVAWSAQCQQTLDSVYPDISNRFPGIVEREIKLEDMREAFVNTFQRRTSAPIVRLESSPTAEAASREQRPFAEAAAQALAYLLVVTPHYFGLGPSDKDFAQWAVGTGLDVSLWSVADRKLVAGPLRTGPYVNVQLSDLRSLLDEPGLLRTRLAPNFEVAAGNILEQQRFILAP